ncbi:dolichyl-phosphate-mannose--protein mannosyltransferase [Corynebacterium heidelbergense]|uniref:Polyprenol-phosphate-mannose--protein mannosyltransferase n=1 Tax=Corynebacterium heidelbergense TaxID=2055947 RepID=A0A364V540_9CORY|nr:phospholipid carrier-dependent glycosyltransferase [Corynebacterium heidelbergense]RAV31742.1 dolichyl-phosphate-mannose--protein mannosyltransferase [Corynebacterium heidelbergense]
MRLGRPTDAGTPVFDEKHYVPQSWQMLRSWDNWLIGGIEDNPGFGLVVHPPLGKQLEAAGMALFGYTPTGWRIASAVVGIGVVILTAALARRISRSDFVGLLAGIFAASEGILFVTGRSGMLDHFQVLFVVGAAYLLVRDHEQMNRRMARVREQGRIRLYPAGPRLGYRWWRFAAGVALGLALSVKWSGLYYIAFFGVACVAAEAWRRRRFGVRRPVVGALAFDACPALAALVGLPAAVYVFSFRAWFASESGVFRHAAESNAYPQLAGWKLSFLPDSVQGFLYYHASVLKFHSELTNSNGHYHNWESKPWSWLASTRSLMYYNPKSDGGIHHVVLLVGTPAVWWPCVPALLWALWCLIIRHDARFTVPLVGFAAGFLPWLLNLDRQMYLFYAVNLSPFVVILLALTMGQVVDWRLPVTSHRRWIAALQSHAGIAVVVGYSALVVWNFLFFLPIYTAMPLDSWGWQSRMWLPSWS